MKYKGRIEEWEPRKPKPVRFLVGDLVTEISNRRKPISTWKVYRVEDCIVTHVEDDEIADYECTIKSLGDGQTYFINTKGLFKLNMKERLRFRGSDIAEKVGII